MITRRVAASYNTELVLPEVAASGVGPSYGIRQKAEKRKDARTARE
jgi:hypothetical protein